MYGGEREGPLVFILLTPHWPHQTLYCDSDTSVMLPPAIGLWLALHSFQSTLLSENHMAHSLTKLNHHLLNEAYYSSPIKTAVYPPKHSQLLLPALFFFYTTYHFLVYSIIWLYFMFTTYCLSLPTRMLGPWRQGGGFVVCSLVYLKHSAW